MVLYILRTKLFTTDRVDRDLLDRLAKLLAAFVLTDVALTAIDALIALNSLHPTDVETWLLIFTGEMAWSFWVVMVGLGWVLPLALVSRRTWRRTPWLMALVGVSVVVGIIGVRFNIVVPPLIVPVMHQLPHGEYFPTLVEWGTSFGMMAVGLLLYTLGAELLPLTPLGGDNE
jgi:molybdopterin-containing oxidoreductase family membrane subunit